MPPFASSAARNAFSSDLTTQVRATDEHQSSSLRYSSECTVTHCKAMISSFSSVQKSAFCDLHVQPGAKCLKPTLPSAPGFRMRFCSNKVVRKQRPTKKPLFSWHQPARDLCTRDSVALQERLRWLRENCSWYSSCCSRSCQLPGMPASFRKVLKNTPSHCRSQSFTTSNHGPQKPCSSSTIRHGIDKFGM